MLPDNFFNGGIHGSQYGDAEFLKEQIEMIPPRMQKEVSNRYSEIYISLTDSDPQNVRYRANTWVRATVKKNLPNKNNSPFYRGN